MMEGRRKWEAILRMGYPGWEAILRQEGSLSQGGSLRLQVIPLNRLATLRSNQSLIFPNPMTMGP